jgi:hypothetical protein
VLAEKGIILLTTLVKNNRFADKYLQWALKKTSGVAPRTIDQLNTILKEIGMPMKYNIKGNMAFITGGIHKR